MLLGINFIEILLIKNQFIILNPNVMPREVLPKCVHFEAKEVSQLRSAIGFLLLHKCFAGTASEMSPSADTE